MTNPFDFTPALVDEIFAPLQAHLANEEIARQFQEEAAIKRGTQMHIIIMRVLWDEMIDKGSQLLPKDVRMLADKLTDELEKLI
jgi:hypothetical protein